MNGGSEIATILVASIWVQMEITIPTIVIEYGYDETWDVISISTSDNSTTREIDNFLLRLILEELRR